MQNPCKRRWRRYRSRREKRLKWQLNHFNLMVKKSLDSPIYTDFVDGFFTPGTIFERLLNSEQSFDGGTSLREDIIYDGND